MTKPSKISLRVIGVLLLFLLTSGVNDISVSALKQNQWVSDQRIPGYRIDTYTPTIIADRYGIVHAFASQRFGGPLSPVAIVYRQWSFEKGWTSPVEVLELPYGYGDSKIHGAYIDKNDTMHIVFWGGDPVTAYIFYASAPLSKINLASAWSLPTLLGGEAFYPSSASIIGDEQDNLFILYNGKRDPNSVYAIHSSDSGLSWDTPTPIFLTYDLQEVPLYLQLHTGPNGQLFAVWTVVNYLGRDLALYYSTYDSEHGQWRKSILLDKRPSDIDEGAFGPSFPVIASNGKDIVIMYNNGNTYPNRSVSLGAPVQAVRMSSDGGQSWSDALVPFPEHIGRSGEHTLAVDSAGGIHAVFIQRIDQLSVEGIYAPLYGIWHSIFNEGSWGSLNRIVTTVQPHDIKSVVVGGNVLLMVWREDPGLGVSGIWYTYTVLDTPSLVEKIPVEDYGLSPLPVNTPVFSLATIEAPDEVIVVEKAFLPDFMNQPAGPLIFGVLFVFLILAGVVILYRFARSR